MRTEGIEKSGSITLKLCLSWGLVLVLLSWSAPTTRAQNPKQPQKGYYPAGSYALSDIENINTTNGNVIFHIPLVSLPPGRGGLSAGVGLYYNSKIWETYSYEDGRYEGYSYSTVLRASDSGGWRYGFRYDVQLVHRYDENQPAQVFCGFNNAEDNYVYKLKMKFPDGSEHVFRPSGYTDQLGDNFFRMRPDGWMATCGQPDSHVVFTGMTYYSADGTFMRLTFGPDGDSDWSNNPWTLSLPDGTRVTGGNGPQRVYDRNNNYVEVRNITYNNHPASEIADQLGRHIVVEYGPAIGPYPESARDYIHAWRMQDGQLTELVWTIKWRGVSAANKSYYINPNDVNIGSTTFGPGTTGLSEIDLPTQAGGLSYSFGYNVDDPTGGWGEVSSMTLPSGAQTNYKYYYDITSAPESVVMASDILKDYPYQKDLKYQLEYDGTSTPTTETWQYSVDETSCVITAPDGGVTREHFNNTNTDDWDSGLSYKTENPDGSVVERVWRQNIPYGYGSSTPAKANSYVKTEFVSIRNAAGALVKTAIKDYTYDKNGNVTQEADYDWVNYDDVPRDGGGKPTGVIPASAQVKRVTVNSYYSPTPDADSTAFDADIYTQYTAPTLRNTLESGEVRSGFTDTSVLSRTELFYDNTLTTGNLTEQRVWDSTKGALSRPLSPGTYVSTTHQYDTFGNPTLSTDANGNQTQFIYEAVNGVTDLYPTKTITAQNTAVQRTSLQEYDFYSGLVTRATDFDDNVSTSTTYDVFGRPTLVKAAEGKPEETRAVTVYSDVNRRVIVRSDLNAVGDGKLVSIQHYDQLGRVRLTRTLEDASTQSETDETTGIKVQTRYAYGNPATDPYSYTLISNPYRAATSAAASSEQTMGWSRTKVDNGGRTVEAQTFGGASLPAPWGSNSSSTGSVTTAYDAEYTTVTDQANKPRRSVTDALGRLVRVDEPDGSNNLGPTTGPVQPTAYTYDALGNLRKVNQGGQLRFFMYDSLSRLIRAKNPEQGVNGAVTGTDPVTGNTQWAMSYAYDNNGNLTSRTDARGVTASYTYDALSRNTVVTYVGGGTTTPTVNRFYDGATNGKGRMWRTETVGVSTTVFDAYDALGRPMQYHQAFWVNNAWGQSYNIQCSYNKAGGITSETYPSGHSVSYNYDAAGRLGDNAGQPAFSGNLGDGAQRTYASEVLYHPAGGMRQERYGTDTPVYNKHLYNNRIQLAEIRVSTYSITTPGHETDWNRGAIINHYSSAPGAWGATGGGPDNNGNLQRQEIYVPDNDQISSYTNVVQQYSYDSLNRLTSVYDKPFNGAADFVQAYQYDRWGNRTIDQTLTTSNAPKPQYSVDSATNRLGVPSGQSGVMSYDAAGNLTNDTYQGGGGTRTYDAEGRITQAQFIAGQLQTATYTYDADGRRVKRNMGAGGEVWQVYGMGGELLAEYAPNDPPSMPQKEYGYRNGQLLVTADAGGSPATPIFSDDFNDNSLDTSKWAVQYPNSSPVVSEQGQQLQIALTPNAAGYNGVSSNSTYNLTGRMVQVEVAQVVSQAGWAENMLELALDSQNRFLIDVGSTSINFESKVNGVRDVTTLTYDPALHHYWRVRHDQQSNTIKFETSTDGLVWTTRKSVSPGFSLTSLRINLVAGAWGTGNGNPGAAKYDNFKLLPSTAGSISVTVANFGFESPSVGYGNFQYGPTGGSWTFASAGVSAAGSGFTSGTTVPEGAQVAFLQGTGSFISQSVSGFQASTNYVVTFAAAQRTNCCNAGGQDFQVYLDDTLLGTFHPASGSYADYSTQTFTTTAGAHTLKFVGVNSLGGDHTAFIDNVRVTGSPAAAGAGLQWLVADQLGTPRVVLDKTGSLAGVKRHDYYAFGEEIPADGSWRTAARGYVGDNVRQKFTQKERDIETGLDYFGARYYSSAQGRFTSTDPLLSSGRIYNPQTWNRYAYTLNNPLKYIDPSGLFEFDSSFKSQKDKDRFKKMLVELEKARDHYKKKGDVDKYEALRKVREAYGTENDGNGVTIAIGKVTKGAAAETGFGTDAQGHPVLLKQVNGKFVPNVVVTFGSAGQIDLEHVAHEGSHVEDRQNYVNAFIAASQNNPLLTDAQAKMLPENLTKYATESKAYHVSSYIEEYNNTPGEVWNRGWKEVDRQKAIDNLLKTNGLYNVTPTQQGTKLYQ